MKKLIFPIIILAAYFFSGCSSHEEERTVHEIQPIPVSIITVAENTSASQFEVSANIQPEKEANISTRLMGYVERVNAAVGQKVSKGQVLVKISSTDLQAKLAQVKANIVKAEAAVGNAKKDFDRITTLYEQSSVTQKELDDITAHYSMAKAGLEAARQMENEVNAQFTYTSIRAPFSGIVTAKNVNQGDMANPGMPLMTIADNRSYQAVAMVPESKIAGVRKNDEVTVQLKSADELLIGKVSEIGISSNNTGGQYIVKVDLPDAKVSLFAGMYANVFFKAVSTENTVPMVVVDESMLTYSGSLKGVYTVSDDNRAMLRWLRLGSKIGPGYEVLSGLEAGEKIIAAADSRLFNGAPVTIK